MLRVRNWSVRTKLAGLMLAASLLPLAISAYLDIRENRARLIAGTQDVLAARADQITREFDSTHAGYARAVQRLAAFPDTAAYCAASGRSRVALQERVSGILATFPASDADIRGAGVIDGDGHMAVATERALIGMDFSSRATIRTALGGASAISSVYLSSTQTGERPSIAYLMPVRGAEGRVLCAVGLWVHADTFWRLLKASNGLAGPGSFAVLFDRVGIRIAHSYDDEIVFHPGGPLPSSVVDALVAEKRFGQRTRKLLEDVRAFPAQFEMARSASPDPAVFHGFAPVNQKWNYGVGRRLRSVPWTVFYMVPEANLMAQLSSATRPKALLAASIMSAALLLGVAFAASILRPVRALAKATTALADGANVVHVPIRGSDELAQLGTSFNTMADRLQAQSVVLQQSNDDLEKRVRERTGLLNAILDNSTAVIYVKDLQGRFLLVNDRFSQLFHLTKEQVIGKTNHDIFDQATADALYATDQRVTGAAGALVEEEMVPQDDGVHTYLSAKCPLLDDMGQAYGIVGVSTDITDRKLAESRQLAQLERMNLLDQITIAIGERQDLQSIYQVAIRSLEERMPVDFSCICDYDAARASLTVTRVGVHSHTLAMDLAMGEQANIPVDQNGLSRSVRGQLVYEPDIQGSAFPFPNRLARGGLRSLVIAPLMAESRVFGVLVVARREPNAFSSGDCEFLRQLSGHVALAAQQAQLNEALRQAYDDLRRSQQAALQQERLSALGQMASGIAHDISNAISPVALYTETLLEREPGLSERARNYLKVIARAIDDVAATVARMREFSRQREPQTSLRPMDLNQLVRQVVELTHARWSDMPQQRGVSIDLHLELDDHLPPAMGIESEVREALINLIFNAVDAMPLGGVLTVQTREARESKRVELRVKDTGVGMDEETRRRCLEPFFSTKGTRGTGLGLAMVYGMAQRHDATLGIESATGRGTQVCLGFAVPTGGATVAEPAAPEPPPPSRMQILIVDDDPLLLKSLWDALQAEGHAVTAASGGQAGIDAFRSAQESGQVFDVVITDLGMARVDGRQVAAAIKRMSPGTPIVLLTGWGQRLVDDNEVPADVDMVLNKPPKLRELRAVLSLVLKDGNHG